MINKLYGFIDTDDIFKPYHFKNCSKNNCVTKQYLGYTLEYGDDALMCGGGTNCGVFEGYSAIPNFCCLPLPPKNPVVVISNIFPEIKWYLETQNTAPTNCYDIRFSSTSKLIDLSKLNPTSVNDEFNLNTIGNALCTKPSRFIANPNSIVWLTTFPASVTSIDSPTKNLEEVFIDANINWPDENERQQTYIAENYYPYNYQISCDYDITLVKETYSAELELDITTPFFIELTYALPKSSIGEVPFPCISNPIYGESYTENSNCTKNSEFLCKKELNPQIIYKKETGKSQETIGCCNGSPQENYCCNKDFLKKIETDINYKCFNVKTEVRKFIGMENNDSIHCEINNVTDQYYPKYTTIPICMAIPGYITIINYDVVLQGDCSSATRSLGVGSGDGDCPAITDCLKQGDPEACTDIWEYEAMNYCIKLNLTYVEPTVKIAKQGIILEFYYCQITYGD